MDRSPSATLDIVVSERSQPADPLRIALIGCGTIAQSMHLPVLAGHEHIRLAALVDRSTERAERLAKGYGVPRVLADASELSADAIDAAILATPAAHHAPCAIDLMRRGIHVLVEKPMALTSAEAERMVQVADQTGRRLAVGYFRRLYPSLRLMKSLLESRYLGAVQRFEAEGGGRYTWAAATLANMSRELAGGGVLIDYGSHILDAIFFLFDEPFDIVAYEDNSLGGVEADCVIDARLTHAARPIEGRIALARTRGLGNFVRVECERGYLTFDIGERFRVRAVPKNGATVDPFDGCPRRFSLDARWDGQQEDEPWYDTFRRQIDDWLESIRHDREPRLSGRSALATTRLIDACYARPARMSEPWVSEGIERAAGSAAISTRSARRVLLTGGTGFIGGRVAEILALRDGWQVRALVHNPGNASRLARLPIELVQADLQDEKTLARLVAGCDAVVHCAVGTAWGQRQEIFKVTVDGTKRLAEAALAAGVKRFIHLSTISVYGDDGAMQGTIDEATPVKPVAGSEYGESKAAAERAVQEIAQRGLAAVIFRPARVYGPFSRIFIERPLPAIAEGRFRWLGNPHVPADMVYIDSVVHAIVLALEADERRVAGEIFTVGDGDPITWYDFYRYFAALMQADLSTVPLLAREGDQDRRRSVVGGLRAIVTSPEFKHLGRRVLDTDPIGTLPRWTLERVPATERFLRRLVGADESLPIHRRDIAETGEIVTMGSGGARVSIDKLQRVLGFEPPVSRTRALDLTWQWAQYARVVSPARLTT
jgi:predicted dehydrogenase/nucleoside-diphosphate-sugar epimerase